MFPIILTTGTKLGLPPQKLAILTAVASSAGFATPISYQTNLMVYGPGGYKFKDYLRIGLPLQFLTAIVALLALSLLH